MMPATVAAKPRRTRYAHGVPLPRVADGRTQAAKRFRVLVEGFALELGGGALSEPERGLIAQTAAVQIQCEQLQRAIVEGREVDADMLVRLSSEHRRLLSSLRAKAEKAKPTGPSVEDLFAVEAEAGAE